MEAHWVSGTACVRIGLVGRHAGGRGEWEGMSGCGPGRTPGLAGSEVRGQRPPYQWTEYTDPPSRSGLLSASVPLKDLHMAPRNPFELLPSLCPDA